MNQKIKNNWSYISIVFFFIVTLTYIVIKGEGIYIQIHDNLDSNIAWLKMLKDNHLFWKIYAKVPFLRGINRNYLYSEWKAYSWLYMLLPTFIAMVVGWYGKIMIDRKSVV